VGVLAAALALSACEASKSSNPLSASVAGPIPGIQISAPKTLQPEASLKIAMNNQPVVLLIENAGSNGPRPLVYSFDVATDAASAGVLAGSAASDEGGSGPHPGPSGSGEPSERVRLGASAGDHWLKGLAGHVNLAMRHPDLDGASIQSQALPQRRLASASGTEASEPVLAPAGAKSSGPVSGRGKPPEPG